MIDYAKNFLECVSQKGGKANGVNRNVNTFVKLKFRIQLNRHFLMTNVLIFLNNVVTS